MNIYFSRETFPAKFYEHDLSGEVMLALPGSRRMLCESVPPLKAERLRKLLDTHNPIKIEDPSPMLVKWLNAETSPYFIHYGS